MCSLECHMPVKIAFRDEAVDSVAFTRPVLFWSEH